MNNRGAQRSPTIAQRQLAEARSQFESELDELGWTTREVMRRLTLLAEANKTLVAQRGGEFTDELEVADNPVRMAALTTILQIKRAFPATKVEVGGTVRVEQLQAIAVRLEAMPADQLDKFIDSEDMTVLDSPEVTSLPALREEAPVAQERQADVP